MLKKHLNKNEQKLCVLWERRQLQKKKMKITRAVEEKGKQRSKSVAFTEHGKINDIFEPDKKITQKKNEKLRERYVEEKR